MKIFTASKNNFAVDIICQGSARNDFRIEEVHCKMKYARNTTRWLTSSAGNAYDRAKREMDEDQVEVLKAAHEKAMIYLSGLIENDNLFPYLKY